MFKLFKRTSTETRLKKLEKEVDTIIDILIKDKFDYKFKLKKKR